MVARFDAATDVTLDELRIELTYPRARPPSASSAIGTQPTTRSARLASPRSRVRLGPAAA